MSNSITFWKLEAAGNDFVMIDNRAGKFDINDKALITAMCHRRFGVGADGLIAVSAHPDYDFEMKYFNSDGSGPVMCGNGARASVLFAKVEKFFAKNKIKFLAPDGEHEADLSDNYIKLTIQSPTTMTKKSENEITYFVDTGTNHIIIPVENIEILPIQDKAPYYREKYDSNVNYIEKKADKYWQIRTWERGVEGETYACGTGATACAYFIHEYYNIDYPITLAAKGGELTISLENNKLWLQGPADVVFEGTYKI